MPLRKKQNKRLRKTQHGAAALLLMSNEMSQQQESHATPRGTRGQFLFVNALTLSRGVLLLMFMAGVLVDICQPLAWLKWLNLALLVVSSVTDLFDGLLARKWNVTSRLGAVLDPMMDKVFFIIVFPTLTSLLFYDSAWFRDWLVEVPPRMPFELPHAILMLVLTVSYILRDQWVMALRALAAGSGADMKANWVGKTRTALSFPIGCMLYCYIAFGWHWLTQPLMIGIEAFAIAINLYSFVAYTIRYANALKTDHEASARA